MIIGEFMHYVLYLLMGLYSCHVIYNTAKRSSYRAKTREIQNRVSLVEAYTEYVSAKLIAEGWHEQKLVGVCKKCGGDDAAIISTNIEGNDRCKWCAELENLSYHLRYNGTRRLMHVTERRPDIYTWMTQEYARKLGYQETT